MSGRNLMSHIKECFTSRFPGGTLLEVDWSQLEVVMLAVESQDPVLKHELNEGMDLHSAMTAHVYHLPYSLVVNGVSSGDPELTALRKLMKSARFALQYGASAKKLAVTSGLSESEAKDFINLYYSRYKGINIWNTKVKSSVLESARPTGELDEEGVPVYKGQYTGPNGRRYVFTGGPKYGKLSFSPTKLQNYPIQGLASDFVKMMRSKVLREMYQYTYFMDVLHVNTIHDSIMFDCRSDEERKEILHIIDKQYSRAQIYLYEMLYKSRDVDVPLKYSVKISNHWS